MRLPISLFVAAVLLATPAFAEVFTVREELHFSLSRGSVTSPEDQDLWVTSRGVSAKYGIKRAGREGDFELQEVTVLGEPYELKDAAGGRWRMWIRTGLGNLIEVELIRANRPAPTMDRTFRAVSVSIDGAQAEPTFSQLTLFADGSYQYGTVRGHYQANEGGVTLDGTPAQWGRAAYTVNGDGLTFRFRRGLFVFEVKYEQLVNVANR